MWWLEKGCRAKGKFYSRPGSSSMAGLILEVRFVKNFASFSNFVDFINTEWTHADTR